MKFKEDARYFYFIAEASNELADLQNQTVWQSALLKSKDYFLKNGVISLDHRHRNCLPKNLRGDRRYIVGEPVSVETQGTTTLVTGRLYKDNNMARIIIELLRRGSNRVKASIGGLGPQRLDSPDGRRSVVSFLWDDVALTVAPVNNTLKPARGIKISEKEW